MSKLSKFLKQWTKIFVPYKPPKTYDFLGKSGITDFHEKIFVWRKVFTDNDFYSFPSLDQFKLFLYGLCTDLYEKRKSEEEAFQQILKFVQQKIKYLFDKIDHWQSYQETISLGCGDCEDFATVVFWMVTTVFPLEKNSLFRMGMFLNEVSNNYHMVILYYKTNDPLILDATNTICNVPIPISKIDAKWKLQLSFNLQGEWIHTN